MAGGVPKHKVTCEIPEQELGTKFVRKRNRLRYSAHMGRRWYFVTLCTRDRKPLLREGQLVSAVLKNLEGARSSYQFDIYAYCFMPDRLHLLLSGLLEICEVPVFMRSRGKTASMWRHKAASTFYG